ncbi:hypothetical protein CI102_15197 [Trichoderma harzianum]|nr:hypothetical protein CI102_15197 [Trichoderma harzianum]
MNRSVCKRGFWEKGFVEAYIYVALLYGLLGEEKRRSMPINSCEEAEVSHLYRENWGQWMSAGVEFVCYTLMPCCLPGH